MAATAIFRAVDDEDGTGSGQIAGEVAAVVDVDGVGAEGSRKGVAADAGKLGAELVRDFIAAWRQSLTSVAPRLLSRWPRRAGGDRVKRLFGFWGRTS